MRLIRRQSHAFWGDLGGLSVPVFMFAYIGISCVQHSPANMHVIGYIHDSLKYQ